MGYTDKNPTKPSRDYVQDVRYIAKEHMEVRRDCVSFARQIND